MKITGFRSELYWMKLDRPALEQSGGMAIYFGKEPRVETVAERLGAHPWAN